MSPGSMPAHKPLRVIQGRYAALVRKWSSGQWQYEERKSACPVDSVSQE
jgi:hypothetical protein